MKEDFFSVSTKFLYRIEGLERSCLIIIIIIIICLHKSIVLWSIIFRHAKKLHSNFVSSHNIFNARWFLGRVFQKKRKEY
jgi:hypothetical protein